MAAIPLSPVLSLHEGSRFDASPTEKQELHREFRASVDAELLHCIDSKGIYSVCVYGYPAADLSVLLTLQGLPSLLSDGNKLLIATSLDEAALRTRIQACISKSDNHIFTCKLSHVFDREQQEAEKRQAIALHQQAAPVPPPEAVAQPRLPVAASHIPPAPVSKKKGGKQKDAAPQPSAPPTATFRGVAKPVVVEAPEAVLPAIELDEVCKRVCASIQSRIVITVEKRGEVKKGETLIEDFLQHIIICHAIKDGWCPFMDGVVHIRTGPSSFVPGGLQNVSRLDHALSLLQPAGVLPVTPPNVYDYATIHITRQAPGSDIVTVRIDTKCIKLSQPPAGELKKITRDGEPLHLLPTGCELRLVKPVATAVPAPGSKSALRLLKELTAASDYAAMRTEAVARWQNIRVHANVTDITFQAILEGIQLRRLACMGMRNLDDAKEWAPASMVEASIALPQWRNMLVMHDPYMEASSGTCSMLLPHECLFSHCSLQRHASRERCASTVEAVKTLIHTSKVKDNTGAWRSLLVIEDSLLDTSLATIRALDNSADAYVASEAETPPRTSQPLQTTPAPAPVPAPAAGAKPFVFARASTMWSKPVVLVSPVLTKATTATTPAQAGEHTDADEAPKPDSPVLTWDVAPTQPFAAWLNPSNTANVTTISVSELLANALSFVQGAHAQLSASMYMKTLRGWKDHNWSEKMPLPLSFRGATLADHMLHKRLQNAMSEAAVARGESPVPNFDFSLLRKEGSMVPLSDAGFGRETKGKAAADDAEDDDAKGSGLKATTAVSGVKRKAPTGASGGAAASKAKQAKKVAFAEDGTGAGASAADEVEAANVKLVAACGKDEAGLKKFDMKILKSFLRSKGKKVGGTKPELIARILTET